MEVTKIKFKGEDWTRVEHSPYEKYLLGVDPGFTVDPTGIAVVHHQRIPIPDDFLPNYVARKTEQRVQERYDVVHLERMPLGVEYVEQVQHIVDLMERAPLCHVDLDLVVDKTGIGVTVAQLLERAGKYPIKVSITGSTTEQVRVAHRDWHVGKALLIASLNSALHTSELKFAPALLEASAMREELTDFNRLVGAAGRATYQARTGAHDDLVLACALCTWWAGQARKNQGLRINNKTPEEMARHLRQQGIPCASPGQSAPNVKVVRIDEAGKHLSEGGK